MDLFTILMDFRGGTYINQVNAPDYKKAVQIWANDLNTKDILYFSEKSKEQLIKAIPDIIKTDIVNLYNLKNTWSFTIQFKTGFAIVNIVKTSI